MSKLEELVPPLELCKRIPEGKFADSALVLIFWCKGQNPPEIRMRCEVENDPHFDYLVESKRIIIYPAPTLAEIFAQLPQTSTVTWFTQEEYPNNFAVCCYVLQPKPRKPKLKSEIDDNPAAAALKLFLEMEARR